MIHLNWWVICPCLAARWRMPYQQQDYDGMPWIVMLAIGSLSLFAMVYVMICITITRHLRRSTMFDPHQKVMQLCIVWLVPILGPALVAAILLPEVRVRRQDFS